MTYYQDLKNAKEYINRAGGYDGKIFIPTFQKYDEMDKDDSFYAVLGK